jgi:hypothetical protein
MYGNADDQILQGCINSLKGNADINEKLIAWSETDFLLYFMMKLWIFQA